MTKFLIAGFGSIGRRHFRNLLALGQRDILFYRTGRSTLPDDELDGFIVETDLNSPWHINRTAVIVANPTAAHLSTALTGRGSGLRCSAGKTGLSQHGENANAGAGVSAWWRAGAGGLPVPLSPRPAENKSTVE